MSKMKNLEDLFHHQLKDLYSAEEQLIEALPKTAEKATDKDLKKALNDHLKETKEQKKRLEQIGKELGIELSGEKCKAMAGLIKETEDFLKEDTSDEVKDAGIIAECQRIEHYEISGYGTAKQYAESLGEDNVAELLGVTLEEESDANEKLNDLAVERINSSAVEA